MYTGSLYDEFVKPLFYDVMNEKPDQRPPTVQDIEVFGEMRDRLGGIDPATDMDERREVQAELDAAAFHAYGLDRDQAAFVLDDFHRVQSPRIMDEDYFETVLNKYDELD